MKVEKSALELKEILQRMDRKPYPVYKSIQGAYRFSHYQLAFDHIQGDPFASPSRIRVCIKGEDAGFPKEYLSKTHRRIALQDYITRIFYRSLKQNETKNSGSGKSGLVFISRCGQEILERTACALDSQRGDLCLQLELGLPAHGRSIYSAELIRILFEFLPACIERTCFYSVLDKKTIEKIIFLADDQQYIRDELPKMGLVAFVANDSILPRESGVSDKPLKGAVRFKAPEAMTVKLTLPHAGIIKGMGIPKGVTLIVGGGYHGKSTLLQALELGVYNHIALDGREFVITDSSAVKIRAEDGRNIQNVDISLFINHLPNKKDTVHFYSENASGSTSQAANIIEAIESKAKLFLIDEDTSATNFMIRDELMQQVVNRASEPITPFIQRIRPIARQWDISTILVAGSIGAYFHIADTIIQMNQYVPYDITKYAKEQAKAYPFFGEEENMKLKAPSQGRVIKNNKDDRRNERPVKVKTASVDQVLVGKEAVDLRFVEQIVDLEQNNTLGYLIKYAKEHFLFQNRELGQVVDELYEQITQRGLAELFENQYLKSNLAMPRLQEVYACFNRCRGITII